MGSGEEIAKEHIPFLRLANHSFRSIFKNVFAPNPPFETCPIRDRFSSLHPAVVHVTNEHGDADGFPTFVCSRRKIPVTLEGAFYVASSKFKIF